MADEEKTETEEVEDTSDGITAETMTDPRTLAEEARAKIKTQDKANADEAKARGEAAAKARAEAEAE
jgi:hypothetical protein